MMDKSCSKEANRKIKHNTMTENSVNENPGTTKDYGLQEASPGHDSIQHENENNSTNFHEGCGNIVSDEKRFNTWMPEMEIQIRVMFVEEADKRQPKSLSSSLYPELS